MWKGEGGRGVSCDSVLEEGECGRVRVDWCIM